MNKQLLTIGIVLSLGTVGCAGLGVQNGSTLNAQAENEQGFDNLWVAHEKAPTGGLDGPVYAEQGLGALWDPQEEAETSGGAIGSYANRSLGNLWNGNL
ncbi:MAG: hypothetical protein DRH23_06080 [Deltaproteobacteria bacterium]|nr:hypothetical protein [Deltaproteobacteria bacterium]MBW2405019.1 hypothetical protein [Deltaproteobacteria bacterium]MBW2548934.1 hypothetical protein [Deltaproteobacteria bacterium]RLB49683.1 MAG: hypothetical protein DRH23_06080 [Deltaproteobacteria bacterium]